MMKSWSHLALLLALSGVTGQNEDSFRYGQRPARAQELFEKMCQGQNNVFEEKKNPCMCNFLAKVVPARMDLMSLKGAEIPCVDGFASAGDESYPCHNVNLLSRVGLSELLSVHGNANFEEASDIWGWVGPNDEEIAIIGLMSGTSFVDVTDPLNPVFLGNLPAKGGRSTYWRDIKTYENFAYIVSENQDHGLQVIDMNQMIDLDLSSGPVLFGETYWDTGFGNAHNIAINEESGYAYIVGSNQCAGGLYMMDLENPAEPQYAGCFDDDGYVHDVQCNLDHSWWQTTGVYYQGMDASYKGREICFACNEDTVTIIDVTEKSDPVQLSRTTYSGVAYTHQGWLTEDHNAFLFGDEEDEDDVGKRTTTYVLKVEDLERPVLVGSRESFKKAVDHNMYTLGNYVYQANYNAGLQVLEIGDVANTADLTEIAFFDMFPESDDDDGGYAGAWSNYPYFPSGNVIVSSIDRGLFVLSVNRTGTPVEPPDDPCYAESNRCSSFLGLRKGVMMHRRRLGLFCQRRCVPESRVDYRLEVSGWQCGRRCE